MHNLMSEIQELKNLIVTYVAKSYLKRDLESWWGKLQHACKIVKPGRTFLRRMTVAMCQFKSYLKWWAFQL